MAKLVSQEGGRFPFNFDQREKYSDVPPIVVQAMLVAPERKRRLKVPAETPAKPRLSQKRQSRITVALEGTDPRFSYRPAKSDHHDIGVRFDRKNATDSLAGCSLDSRPTLSTARRRQTTVPLSGQPPLEPTHRLVNLNVPFETVAIALSQPPSEFKLNILTTGHGGLAFSSSRNRYQELLAKRAGTERISTGTEPSIVKTEPSEDLNSKIPW